MSRLTFLTFLGICALSLLLSGCATTTPSHSQANDLCRLFKARPQWYKYAYQANKRWDVPIHVMMAIMKQESHYVAEARPPRPWFLFIPLPRRSSAYGYAQAQDPVWEDYKEEASQGWFPSRSSFQDAIDFIGWYVRKTSRVNRVSVWRADELYLNYHEGWGGYRRGTWKKKPWLSKVAKKVGRTAENYSSQLKRCDLPKPGWFW